MTHAELEELTKDELVDRARQAGIEGYSSLNKDELVKALVRHYKDNPPPVPRIG